MGSSYLTRRTLHLKVVSIPEAVRDSDVWDSDINSHVRVKPRFEKGAIVYVEGSDSYEDLMRVIAHHRGFKTFWANRDDEISLSEIHSYGVDLTKLTFTTAKKTAHVLKNALSSALYPIVIAPANELSESEVAELRSLVASASACLFLLSESA